MYIGRKVKLKRPVTWIDMDTFEPVSATEGTVFYERIWEDGDPYNCVCVAYPEGGQGTYKLDQIEWT